MSNWYGSYLREFGNDKEEISSPTEVFQLDDINARVANKIVQRAKKGMETYGQPMTRTDIDMLGWLKNAQEEALDMVVYLERCIYELEEKK